MPFRNALGPSLKVTTGELTVIGTVRNDAPAVAESLDAIGEVPSLPHIEMTVEIKDLKHLDKVIKSIRGVNGVLGVERMARS